MATRIFSQYFTPKNQNNLFLAKTIYIRKNVFRAKRQENDNPVTVVPMAKVMERCVQHIFNAFEGFYFSFPECLIYIIGIYNISAIPL